MTSPRVRSPNRPAVRVALLLDQPGEIEAVLPVMRSAETRTDIAFTPILSPGFRSARPIMTEHLTQFHGAFSLPEPSLGQVDMSKFDVALAPVVSNHPRHALAQRFIRMARVAGLATATMQHGLDNIGISRSHDIGTHEPYVIETDVVCVWFSEKHIPAQCAPAIRARLAHTGRAIPHVQASAKPDKQVVIGVFENLHWNLYDSEFRKAFQSNLRQTAAAFPNVKFVVKPHPGGRWLPRFGETHWPSNVEMFDPDDDVARYDAFDLIRTLSGVVTTPSTVALDAAWLDRPVAIIPTEGAELYEGLGRLSDWRDWRAFVDRVCSGRYDAARQRAFLSRSVKPGDAAAAVCDTLIKVGQ